MKESSTWQKQNNLLCQKQISNIAGGLINPICNYHSFHKAKKHGTSLMIKNMRENIKNIKRENGNISTDSIDKLKSNKSKWGITECQL